jgi:hypothetical protein
MFNLILNETMEIIGVLDWEWSRVVLLQFFIPPLWLGGSTPYNLSLATSTRIISNGSRSRESILQIISSIVVRLLISFDPSRSLSTSLQVPKTR